MNPDVQRKPGRTLEPPGRDLKNNKNTNTVTFPLTPAEAVILTDEFAKASSKIKKMRHQILNKTKPPVLKVEHNWFHNCTAAIICLWTYPWLYRFIFGRAPSLWGIRNFFYEGMRFELTFEGWICLDMENWGEWACWETEENTKGIGFSTPGAGLLADRASVTYLKPMEKYVWRKCTNLLRSDCVRLSDMGFIYETEAIPRLLFCRMTQDMRVL